MVDKDTQRIIELMEIVHAPDADTSSPEYKQNVEELNTLLAQFDISNLDEVLSSDLSDCLASNDDLDLDLLFQYFKEDDALNDEILEFFDKTKKGIKN